MSNRAPTIEQAKKFLDETGREELASRLDISLSALRMAPKQGGGRIPASWFIACKSLREAKGLDCPERFFNFKAAAA